MFNFVLGILATLSLEMVALIVLAYIWEGKSK